MTAAIEREISLLHEYRTRLISDVVTGKLDVRGVAVPEYEAVEEVVQEELAQTDNETEETEDAD
jgi:type I restriction enzyme S subunit